MGGKVGGRREGGTKALHMFNSITQAHIQTSPPPTTHRPPSPPEYKPPHHPPLLHRDPNLGSARGGKGEGSRGGEGWGGMGGGWVVINETNTVKIQKLENQILTERNSAKTVQLNITTGGTKKNKKTNAQN